MRPRTSARQAFVAFSAVTLLVACGYDWGTVQRIGSCANCEIIVKVEGIFDSDAVPKPQMLTWQKEPDEPAEVSLLSNFNFRDGLQSWSADAGGQHVHENAALLTKGSWQCKPSQPQLRYRLTASARTVSPGNEAATSLDFFGSPDCTGEALGTFTSTGEIEPTWWQTLVIEAWAPMHTRSMRARLFTRARHQAAVSEPAFFDNAILQASPPGQR